MNNATECMYQNPEHVNTFTTNPTIEDETIMERPFETIINRTRSIIYYVHKRNAKGRYDNGDDYPFIDYPAPAPYDNGGDYPFIDYSEKDVE